MRRLLPLLLALSLPAAAGAAWSPREVLDPVEASNNYPPQLERGPRGDLVATWLHPLGNYQWVQAASFRAPDAEEFSEPEPVSPGTYGLVAAQRPAVGSDGEALFPLGWFEPNDRRGDGHYAVARRPPGGPAGDPQVLGVHMDTPVEGAVAIGPDGTAVTVFRTGEQIEFCCAKVYAAVRPPGGTFGPPVAIHTGRDVGVGLPPQVGIDAAGNATATWEQDNQLVLSYRPAGGAWSAPRAVGAVQRWALHVAEDGTTTLAWGDSTTSQLRVAVGRDGVLGAPVDVGSIDPLSLVALALNGRGDAALGWTAGRSGSRYPRPAFATRPAGGAWSAPQPLGGCNGQTVDVAIDDDGSALAIWDEPQVIRASIRPAGGEWRAIERVTAADDWAASPDAEIGPDGRAVVLYRSRYREGGYVFATSVTQSSGRLAAVAPSAAADPGDDPDCDIPPPPPPAPLPGLPPDVAPRLAIGPRAERTSGARVAVRLRCTAKRIACSGSLSVRHGGLVLGRSVVRLQARQAAWILVDVRGLPRRAAFVAVAATRRDGGPPTVVRRRVRQ
jgi:hypothetical protein